MGKEMEGGNRQRRQQAKEARERGNLPSAEGVTLGASKQRSRVDDASHEREIDRQRQGKPGELTENTPEAKPRSRDDADR